MRTKSQLLSAGVLLSFALGPSACDFSQEASDSLQIISPANEATFTLMSDTDPRAEGTQIEVIVAGQGEEHIIELTQLRGGPPQVVATATLLSGLAQFDGVPIYSGPNRLVARDATTGRTSLPLTVYLDAACGEVTFIEPQVPENESVLVLGPADDRDGKPCGDSFNLRMVVATGLPDGTSVTLLEGNRAIVRETTRGGVLELEQVPLGPYADDSDGEFSLALRVGDGACVPVPYPVPMNIDCQGPPRCEIQQFHPPGQPLTSMADVDPAPGVQIDIEVLASTDALDRPVLLAINDDTTRAPPATIDLDGGVPSDLDGGVANVRFAHVSLPEGDVRLRAECRDTADNLTESPGMAVTVDSLGCPVTISMPLGDTVFPPDPSQSFASVPLSATFTGGDCLEAYVSVATDETCPNLFAGPKEVLAVGQTMLARTLKLETPGPNTLCVGIRDVNGNDTQDTVRVTFDDGALPPPVSPFKGPRATKRPP